MRIRREVDKLNPSFPAALDRAIQLMERHHLEKGGDKHHGLMRSIWLKYESFKTSPWNLVRLPRQVHIEVHVLMAAAFVGTKWFVRFNSARVIAHALIGSRFDSPLWQKRIEEFTIDGIFYAGDCANKYNEWTLNLIRYAKNHEIRTATISEARTGRSLFSSVSWQKRIKEFTQDGVFYVGKCANKYGLGTNLNTSLRSYAVNRGIRVANIFEAWAAHKAA